MANAPRLVELSMIPPLAKEVATQIDAAVAAKSQVAALTALTGAFGVTGNAIVDVTATPTQVLVNNNFRVLEDKVNAIIAALKA
jgi:hypothetical protein